MNILDRIDNITGLDKEYSSPTPPPPKSVKIELTGNCNFSCFFCAHSCRLRETQEMEKDMYFRLVKEMADIGVKELGVFYLGESFLCKWLPEAIKYAKDVGFDYVFLTTNGSAASPERVKECMQAGLDSLKWSYNYADEEQFVEIARVNPRLFYKMKENIKAAYNVREEGGYKCGLAASYIAYDGEQGEKMQAALTEILPYVDHLYALPLYNQAALVENQEWDFVAGNRGRLDALRDPLPCWSLFTEGHISFDGFLSACCFDHDGRFHMGDLKENTFMECWHSEEFQKLREANLRKDVRGTVCEKCVAYN